MSTAHLNTLPSELLHRIFDHLDTRTILASLRYACKRLYLISHSYNRYTFDFQSVSRPHLQFMCQAVPLENVIALTLSDEDRTRGQIECFLALCQLERLNRVHSLTLLRVDDRHIHLFLNFILMSSLRSLSIDLEIVRVRQQAIPALLSAAIAHQTLESLHLNMCKDDLNAIQWPINQNLHYLRIVNSITFRQFSLILQHSPQLRILLVKSIDASQPDDDIDSSSFSPLTSLTFEDDRLHSDKIEQCLSLTPSLTHLKLVGQGTLFDGYRWEKLIRTKLPQLKKFEFFLSILIYSNSRPHHIELMITPFRTSFWLDDLHCLVTCDYTRNSRQIILYTIPICKTHFVYHTSLKMISLSNFTRTVADNDMDNVTHLELLLTKDINLRSIGKNPDYIPLLFRNVTNLTLGNDGELTKVSIRFLSTIVDLSRIVKLSLSINFIPEYMSEIRTNLRLLLNHASNIRSLFLFDYWTPDNCMARMETICSIMPSNVEHLQIRVRNADEIKTILERLEHLTSVTFEYSQILTIQRDEFVQCLSFLQRASSLWNSQNALHVWLGAEKATATTTTV